MFNRFPSIFVFTALISIFSLILVPQGTIFADIADGTYEVNYEMKEAGNENTSIADGYFSKPATLTVENGTKYIQLTVTNADMVESLSGPNGPVDVISEGDDTRTVKFSVDGDLTQPVNMEMHIIVPDIPEMPGGYDMTHTARAVFDVSGLDQAGATATEENSSEDEVSATAGADKNEKNPPTGDSSSILLYVILLIGSISVLFFAKKRRMVRH